MSKFSIGDTVYIVRNLHNVLKHKPEIIKTVIIRIFQQSNFTGVYDEYLVKGFNPVEFVDEWRIFKNYEDAKKEVLDFMDYKIDYTKATIKELKTDLKNWADMYINVEDDLIFEDMTNG